MKTLRKLGFAALAAMCCFCATSCSDDDDDNKSSVSASIDGSAFTLTNGFWYITEDSYDGREMNIEVFNFDYLGALMGKHVSWPSKINFVAISYGIPSSQNSLEATTVSGQDYHIYIARGVSDGDEGYQAENLKRASNSDLVITRNGSNYTVKIDNVVVAQDDINDTKTFKFSFSGPLPQNTLDPDEFD